MHTGYLGIFTASRIMPKLICYFLEHPDAQISYSSLCQNIGEDKGASWKQMKALARVSFLSVERTEGRLYCRLNREFPLLHEFKNIMEKERVL